MQPHKNEEDGAFEENAISEEEALESIEVEKQRQVREAENGENKEN